MRGIRKHRAWGWIMALVILLNVVPFGAVSTADPGADKTDVLTNFSASVKQGGVEIPEDGTLTSTQPISIEFSFGVPVLGDDPTPANPVLKGDYAIFHISAAFKIISSDVITLRQGDLTLGHVSFATDPDTNMVTATVLFDGDDEIFQEDGDINTVACDKFVASFSYDDSGDAGDVGDHVVTILEKTYTVTVPPAEIIYDVDKGGTADLANKRITWTVDIEATQGGDGIDLFGYRFFDDLTGVGDYISGSFTVDGDPKTPDEEDGALSYAFPEGSTSPKQISFQTTIPDSAYYATTEQGIRNTAELQMVEDEEFSVDNSYLVTFTPKWIEKGGTSSDSAAAASMTPRTAPSPGPSRPTTWAHRSTTW